MLSHAFIATSWSKGKVT